MTDPTPSRRGRKALPLDQRRQANRVQVLLTAAERAELLAAAAAAGAELGPYLRGAALALARGTVPAEEGEPSA